MIRCIVAALALLASAPATAAWQEVRTPHFRIYGEGGTKALRNFAVNLERFDMAIRTLFGLDVREGDDPNPLTVFQVENIATLKTLCEAGRDRRKDCALTAGFYQGRISGSVAFVPRALGPGASSLDAQVVLFHEYAHHLMLAHAHVAYPAWYVEGFAEFVSNANLSQDGEVRVGYPAQSRSWSLYGDYKIPLSAMLTSSVRAIGVRERPSFYARSWLLTHFLSVTPGRETQLFDYLQALNNGKDPIAAADQMFGDLKTLESDLDLYLRRNRFAYLPVKVAPLDPASVRIRVLPPGEAALIPVKMRSQRGVLSSDMEALARDARERAAPWPNDAGAQTALAEAELYAGNVAAAEAAAERALATAADAGDAMVFKALAIMQRARDADDGGEVLWRDARDWLLRANRLSPDAAMPLMLFYKSFIDQGRTPTTNAVAALKRSVELVPQDGSVRMMLASQYLRNRNPRAARKALMPLAFDPHAEPDSPARRLIERIDQEIAATEQSSAASPR
jgi:cytochrome c-type biogenesis protein CcmH/NrfG